MVYGSPPPSGNGSEERVGFSWPQPAGNGSEERVVRGSRYRVLLRGTERSNIERDQLNPDVRVVVSQNAKCVLSDVVANLRSVCY